MYDPASRLIVTNRIIDERVAEARRAHLLRAGRDQADGYEAHDRLATGRSLLGRAAAALRHATRPMAPQHSALR